MTRLHAVLGVVGILAVVAPMSGARASLLFDNLGQSKGGAAPVTSPLYSSFSTGSQSLNLGNVTLQMIATTPGDLGSVRVTLLADSVGTPGKGLAIVGYIADSTLSSLYSTPSLATVASAKTVSLLPNTRYWLELSNGVLGTSSSAYWEFANTDAGLGVSSEFHENSANGSGVVANASSNSAYMMSVDPVPEPDSIAVLGVGLLGLALVWGSRGKKAGDKA